MIDKERRVAVKESRPSGVAAYVLAGGASSRFGQDKALVEFGGKPLLWQLCELIFDKVTRQVFVVGAPSKYGSGGFPCIEDRWPGEGPLGGILTALHTSKQEKASHLWNLIVSCDMPFLTEEILVYLVDRARESDADVLMPRSPSGLEPLCACWRTSALDQLQAAFSAGVRKVTEAAARVRVEVLDEEQWKGFYNAQRLFWNMNTPRDYEEAVRIWDSENA